MLSENFASQNLTSNLPADFHDIYIYIVIYHATLNKNDSKNKKTCLQILVEFSLNLNPSFCSFRCHNSVKQNCPPFSFTNTFH